MLKIVILSALVSVCLAADISDLYGTYTSVVAFQWALQPGCVKFTFSEDPSKVQCTCSDGTKTTLVEMKVVERLLPSQPSNRTLSMAVPILAVDKSDGLALLMNTTCDCAGKKYDFRGAFKTINENYILNYVVNLPRAAGIQEFLMARTLPTAAELEAATTTLADVKDRSKLVLCNQEIYEQLRPLN